MINTTESYLVDIIRSEMQLDAQHVWIKSQNVKFPNTPDMFIIVGMSDAQTLANNNYCEATAGGMKEIQQVQMRENIQVDIVSRNNDAILRRWEVLAAIQSVYSEQVQEANSFSIFRSSQGFLNTSDAEGTSLLNRFTISIPCHVWYRKEKVLASVNGDYYDSFGTRVDDAVTIGTGTGIIEFNITED